MPMSDEDRNLGDPDGWNRRYEEGTAKWDLGATPPVVRRLAAAEEGPRRVLVPGAGYGHDALGWAAAGHEVVAVDFAPLAVAGMKERAAAAGLRMEVLEADVRDLPAEVLGTFDLIWEQTCLCALYPEMREAYVASMAKALKPGGRWLGLMWNNGFEGGPPYDMAPDVVKPLMEAHLEPVEWREVSDALRQVERLAIYRKPA